MMIIDRYWLFNLSPAEFAKVKTIKIIKIANFRAQDWLNNNRDLNPSLDTDTEMRDWVTMKTSH